VEFAYIRSWVANGGRPVATTLPVSEQPVISPGGAVPAFFAGLLPEGRRLSALRRSVKTSADDELTLLLAVGADPVGDVQIVPTGTMPSEAAAIEVRRDFGDIRFAELLADSGIVDPAGIAGVQEKVSARMLALPVRRAHERYILKLEPPEYPHLIEIEHAFLTLARRGVRMRAPGCSSLASTASKVPMRSLADSLWRTRVSCSTCGLPTSTTSRWRMRPSR
jgi:serine/threonine-protein kinase HipA